LANLLQAVASQPVSVMLPSPSSGICSMVKLYDFHLITNIFDLKLTNWNLGIQRHKYSIIPSFNLTPAIYEFERSSVVQTTFSIGSIAFTQRSITKWYLYTQLLNSIIHFLTLSGPLELSRKPGLLSQKFNYAEIGVVRQLITGYRESAAFLLRSADELETMVQIQQKT